MFKEKKQFRIKWLGIELGASDLECITLTLHHRGFGDEYQFDLNI